MVDQTITQQLIEWYRKTSGRVKCFLEIGLDGFGKIFVEAGNAELDVRAFAWPLKAGPEI